MVDDADDDMGAWDDRPGAYTSPMTLCGVVPAAAVTLVPPDEEDNDAKGFGTDHCGDRDT